MTIKQLEKILNEVKAIEMKNRRNEALISKINVEINLTEAKLNTKKIEKMVSGKEREELEIRYTAIKKEKEKLESEIKEEGYTNREIREMKEELETKRNTKEAKEILKNGGKLELVNKLLRKTISESRSLSTYFHKKNQNITWGTKPENSYRLSDHWNWEQGGKFHCITKEGVYSTEKMICIQKNGRYETVEILSDEEFWSIMTLLKNKLRQEI